MATPRPERILRENTTPHEGLGPRFQYTRAFTDSDNESSVPATPEALGGKGFGLWFMTNILELPVPPGYTISTFTGRSFIKEGAIPLSVRSESERQLRRLEEKTGERLGDPLAPLFLSVRSGAEISMPGTMKTILNIGLNDETVHALAHKIGENAAWVAYYHFVKQFASEICHVDMSPIEKVKDVSKAALSIERINQLPVPMLHFLVELSKARVKKLCVEFPQDPQEQLTRAMHEVFSSWNSQEAQGYRKQFGISENLGTAATIQRMVWGNSEGKGAGSGVLMTRDPHTLGDAVVAFTPNIQGDVVVSDFAHAQHTIDDLPVSGKSKLELSRWKHILESYYGFPRDIEFTIEIDPSGKEHAYILQDRKEPLTNTAYVLWLFEQINNGEVQEDLAMRLATGRILYSVLSYDLDQAALETARAKDLLATGQPITNGHASGTVVFSTKEARTRPGLDAVLMAPRGTKVDLLALPPNVKAVFTHGGGIGAHSGRIAARMDKPIIFDGRIHEFVKPGDVVTLNGTTGEVFRGVIPQAQAPGSSLLTAEQVSIAQSWDKQRSENPWFFIAPSESEHLISHILASSDETLRRVENLRSRKAKVELGFTTIIPHEIRMHYDIMKIDDSEGIISRVNEIFSAGNDATLRTGYSPDAEGGRGPWVSLTNSEEMEMFFTNPDYPLSKYGGYLKWLSNPTLTEIFVGEVPKDKLSTDPSISYQHCAWTLSCTRNNAMILQVHPHDPHLRELDDKDADTFITYTIPVDVKTGQLENSIVDVGETLANDELAKDLATLVEQTIRGWQTKHQLIERLAALAQVFPIRDNYSTPSLQGQARIYPDGRSWVLSYDINNDPVRNSNGHTEK